MGHEILFIVLCLILGHDFCISPCNMNNGRCFLVLKPFPVIMGHAFMLPHPKISEQVPPNFQNFYFEISDRRTEVTGKTEPLQFQTILVGSFSLFSGIHDSSSHDSHLTSFHLHLCVSLLPVFRGFSVLFCCVMFFNCICPSQFAQASLWLLASYNPLVSLLQYLLTPQPSSSHRHCSWTTKKGSRPSQFAWLLFIFVWFCFSYLCVN